MVLRMGALLLSMFGFTANYLPTPLSIKKQLMMIFFAVGKGGKRSKDPDWRECYEGWIFSPIRNPSQM